MKKTVKRIGFVLAFAAIFAFVFAIGSTASASESYEAVYGTSQAELIGGGTLAEVLDLAKSDSSIKYIQLRSDITERFVISGGKFTLDLYGKTISSDGYTVLVRGEDTEITFTDTATGGAVKSTDMFCPALDIIEGAFAIFEGGEYSSPFAGVYIDGDSSVIIRGGSFKTDNHRSVSNSGELLIEGGDFQSGDWHAVSTSGNLTVKGGSFSEGNFGHIGYFGGRIDVTEYSNIENFTVSNFSDSEVVLSDIIKVADGYRFIDETPKFVDFVGADSKNYTVIKEQLIGIKCGDNGNSTFFVSSEDVVDRNVVLNATDGIVAMYSHAGGVIEEEIDRELIDVVIHNDERKADVSYDVYEFYVWWTVASKINTEYSENGYVTSDCEFANEGDTVTLSVYAEPGYELDELMVTDETGNPIEITDGKFIMGDTDVTVKATFKATFKEAIEAKWGSDKDNLTNEGSLVSAINAANSGNTAYIQIVRDIEGDLYYILDNATVTIDLNGKRITDTYTDILSIKGNSKVIITDSVGGGVFSDNGYGFLIRAIDNAHLTIHGGKFEAVGKAVSMENGGNNTNAETVIYGGEFSSSEANIFSCYGKSLSLLGGRFESYMENVYFRRGILNVSVKYITLYIDSSAEISEDSITLADGLVSVDNGTGMVAEEFIPRCDYTISVLLTVSFDANGAEGIMEDVKTVPGIYYLPYEAGFTALDGKIFIGWSTSADGEVIDNDFMYLEESVTLYAMWKNIAPVYIGKIELYDGEYLVYGSDEKTYTKPTGKGYVYYKDGKLTLCDFKYDGEGRDFFIDFKYASITVTEDVEIILIGENVIKSDDAIGIYGVGASVTISGDGELYINAYEGIFLSDGDLTVNSVKMCIEAYEDGINTQTGNINILNSKLDVSSVDCCGIYIKEIGNVVIKGSELNIEFQNNGIFTGNGNITLDSNISLTGGESAVSAYGNILINGGFVKVNNSFYGINAYSFYSDDGIYTGGELVIKNAKIDIDVYGYALTACSRVYIGGNDVWIRVNTFYGFTIYVYGEPGSVTESSITLDGVEIITHENYSFVLSEEENQAYVTLFAGDEMIQSFVISDSQISFGTDYVANATHHWHVCTSKLCTMKANDVAHNLFNGSGYEEHSTDGVCKCGYDVTMEYDVYVGGIGLKDGDYLSNEGIITTKKPDSSGYAYYKNGTLYLSGYEYFGEGYVYSTYEEGGYTENISAVIYSTKDLKIEFVGKNFLVNTSLTGEGIYSYGADLELYGKDGGSLYVESYFDGIILYNGDLTVTDGKVTVKINQSYDGIDVTNGDVIINDGEIIINSGDHGIEIDNTVDDDATLVHLLEKGNLYIRDGVVKVNAGDDGFDVELDVVIRGGKIDIYAEDNGIDCGAYVEISGGTIKIEVDEYNGIEASDGFVVHGGSLVIYAYQYGIESYGDIIIYDGSITVSSNYGVLVCFNGDINFGCTVEIITDYEEYSDDYVTELLCEGEMIIGESGEARHSDDDSNHECDECGAPIKIDITVSGVTANDADYSGDSVLGFTGTPKTDKDFEGELEIVYVGRGDTVYKESKKAPYEAGEYTVIIRVPKGNVYYKGETKLDFIIREVFEVSFNANGGTGEMQSVSVNGEYTLPENAFTPPACKIFKGWSASAEGEIISGKLNVVSDTVLYAIYGDSHTDNDKNHLCDACNEKLGEHSYENGTCTICGAKESNSKTAIIIVSVVASVVLIGGAAGALIYMKKRKIQ